MARLVTRHLFSFLKGGGGGLGEGGDGNSDGGDGDGDGGLGGGDELALLAFSSTCTQIPPPRCRDVY